MGKIRESMGEAREQVGMGGEVSMVLAEIYV